MPNGNGYSFDIVQRSQWGARPPRSRTPRRANQVDCMYVHWPGGPSRLRGDHEEILKTPERTASDCFLPEELLPDNFFTKKYLNADPQDLFFAERIDTRAEERAYMREIQNFHMNVRGWSDFAYNYMIFRSGLIYAGRTYLVVPASQAPFNTSGVSICCAIGTQDTISGPMKENLIDFARWCEKRSGDMPVKGHRQVNSTSCPGDRLMNLVPQLSRQ